MTCNIFILFHLFSTLLFYSYSLSNTLYIIKVRLVPNTMTYILIQCPYYRVKKKLPIKNETKSSKSLTTIRKNIFFYFEIISFDLFFIRKKNICQKSITLKRSQQKSFMLALTGVRFLVQPQSVNMNS